MEQINKQNKSRGTKNKTKQSKQNKSSGTGKQTTKIKQNKSSRTEIKNKHKTKEKQN